MFAESAYGLALMHAVWKTEGGAFRQIGQFIAGSSMIAVLRFS
jgi:hypothetical protein